MTYAEYEMAALVVLLVGAGCEVVATNLRRAHPTRMPDRKAAPPIAKTHGTHSVSRDYRSGGSVDAKVLRLSMEPSHDKRAQRRREKREFQAWLDITSRPM